MIRLLQGATILEVFYKRGSTLFNEDVLDFHHIKEQLQQHCSSTIAKELAMRKPFKRTLMKRQKPCVLCKPR